MESEYDDTASDLVIPTLDLTQNQGHDPQYQMMDEHGRYIGQIPEGVYAEEEQVDSPGDEYMEPVHPDAVHQQGMIEQERYDRWDPKAREGLNKTSYMQETRYSTDPEQFHHVHQEIRETPQPVPILQAKLVMPREANTSQLQNSADLYQTDRHGRCRHCLLHG